MRGRGRCGQLPGMRRLLSTLALATLQALWGPAPVRADEALVAVASNFVEPAEALVQSFTAATGHTVTLTPGSTGRLHAQITQGAPFDVFLSADAIRPAELERDGLAVAGTRQTYAVGRLVLWAHATGPTSPLERLETGRFRRLAIANPDLAPYGSAAIQVLEHLALPDTVSDQLVMGENIAQTFAFVVTGNADLGFVALSQVESPSFGRAAQYQRIPADWHDPIRQDAVLLRHGADNPAAVAWLDFLQTEEAATILSRFGYEAMP